jgi:hypothetical protein
MPSRARPVDDVDIHRATQTDHVAQGRAALAHSLHTRAGGLVHQRHHSRAVLQAVEQRLGPEQL